MVTFFILSLIIRSIVHKLIIGKSPFVVGKGKKGFSKYREKFSVLALGIAIVFIILYCVYESLDPYLLVINYLEIFPFKILGSFIIMLGYFFILMAFIHMGKSWRIGIDLETEDELITKGIFSFSRNPIFLGINFYFAGVFLIFPNLLFSVILLLTILGVHWQVIEEERFLKVKYGRDYEAYLNLTGRYFTIGRISI